MKKHKVKVTIRCKNNRGRIVASESVKHDECAWYPAMGEAVASTLTHFGKVVAWRMIAHAVDALDSLDGTPDTAKDGEAFGVAQAMGGLRDAATRVMDAMQKREDELMADVEEMRARQTKLMIEEEE